MKLKTKSTLRNLVLLMLLAFNVKAAEPKANPIMYSGKENGEWIVLTDYWRKEICPPGAYVAYARGANKAELTGCWIGDGDNIILFWLPDYTVVNVPRASFDRLGGSRLTYN